MFPEPQSIRAERSLSANLPQVILKVQCEQNYLEAY